MNEQIFQVEEIVIILLALAVLVGIAARFLRVPYTIGLVLLGLALAARKQFNIEITPNLILALLVPPLVFEAAFHLDINGLRRNLLPILALAVPGVLITTVLVGFVVAWGTGIPLSMAFVFGVPGLGHRSGLRGDPVPHHWGAKTPANLVRRRKPAK